MLVCDSSKQCRRVMTVTHLMLLKVPPGCGYAWSCPLLQSHRCSRAAHLARCTIGHSTGRLGASSTADTVEHPLVCCHARVHGGILRPQERLHVNQALCVLPVISQHDDAGVALLQLCHCLQLTCCIQLTESSGACVPSEEF